MVHVGSVQQHRTPRLPAILADEFVPFGDAPRRGQQEREGEVGGRLGQHAGGISHGDAVAGAGRNVDVVDAHPVVADDFELWPSPLE